MIWLLAYLMLGATAGFLGGLFGIGGGTLLVPLLLMLFEAQSFPVQHSMHLALGSSMAIIIFTSLASMRKHHQHGAVNWSVVREITPGILLGTALGALVAAQVSPHFLALLFAFFLYLAALQILFDIRPHASRQLPGPIGMTLTGLLTGWFSTLVSVGGGTFIVPFLIWCNLSIRNAIGTSSAIGFPIALGGSLGYLVTGWQLAALPNYCLGYIYLPALGVCAIASVITAPHGAKLAHRLNLSVLRKLFALILLGLATKLLLKAVG